MKYNLRLVGSYQNVVSSFLGKQVINVYTTDSKEEMRQVLNQLTYSNEKLEFWIGCCEGRIAETAGNLIVKLDNGYGDSV